jgi:hypothetical protein
VLQLADIERGDNIRIIMHRDGTLHRMMPDGTEVPMPAPAPLAPMTEAEIHAAALADLDAQPLTEESMAHMRPVPRVKTLRRALGLTQEESDIAPDTALVHDVTKTVPYFLEQVVR